MTPVEHERQRQDLPFFPAGFGSDPPASIAVYQNAVEFFYANPGSPGARGRLEAVVALLESERRGRQARGQLPPDPFPDFDPFSIGIPAELPARLLSPEDCAAALLLFSVGRSSHPPDLTEIAVRAVVVLSESFRTDGVCLALRPGGPPAGGPASLA